MQALGPNPSATRPAVVAHADWSRDPKKRWMAVATLEDRHYTAHAPQPAGDVSTLLDRLLEVAGGGPVLAGFDFPIGVPAAYAERSGIRTFRALLDLAGSGEWSRFYDVARRPEEISPRRPFYPQRPGGTSVDHLLRGLGLRRDDLLRRCDRGSPVRPPASSIFWTMGAKQVGKATISGWREVLVPALRSRGAALWPFDGPLHELLASYRLVIAETYPAEFYGHLGLRFGSKRRQRDRRSTAPTLHCWAADNGVDLAAGMRTAIEDGFGGHESGEDPFDAAVGLFGMLGVLLGNRPPGEPNDPSVRRIEGWMLGKSGTPARESRGPRRQGPLRPATDQREDLTGRPAEYDALADLYDLEYVHDHDAGFWLSVADGERGPVVEWGAGTGRIAGPLSEAGHDVTAVELSGRMVERGRTKHADVEWVVGDMRTTPLERRFGLAVCAFNSLLCLLSPADVLASLRNAREHLLPNGLLGIEVSAFSPEELASDTTLQHDFTRRTPDGWLDRFSVTRYDRGSRIMQMRLFYELYGADGTMRTRRAHDLAIRPTDREELTRILEEAGFRVEAVCGGFAGEPFDAASDHLIVLARRP